MVAASIWLSTKGVQQQDWSRFQQDFTDLADMQSDFCDIVNRQWMTGGIKVSCFYGKNPVFRHLVCLSIWKAYAENVH
jgi:hypothetical protein